MSNERHTEMEQEALTGTKTGIQHLCGTSDEHLDGRARQMLGYLNGSPKAGQEQEAWVSVT
jgi:hypothetical protein